MSKNYFNRASLVVLFVLFISALVPSKVVAQINFAQSSLNFDGLTNVSSGVTALMYGPDGRLYVAEYPGTIKILTIERNGPTNYVVTDVEILNGVTSITNHDDDGSPCSGFSSDCSQRETTGITVVGTAANPVIYVTSSDFRIGAGEGGGNGDVDLDTNSGIITRIAWTGSAWSVVDLVRGLPRSEENHATNGLEFININGTDYLVVAQGGHTNGGGPSANFVFTTEYALSAAILSVNLDMLEAMPILNDNGRQYIYDLPTLDDPTRPNANGITDPNSPGYNGVDVNDPFGGNDGLNQAILDPAGPVQILSPGYRNSYDLVVTESGALYASDNGANQGWGGFPVGEGTANVTNAYDPAQPGNQSASGGEQINNLDHLQLITTDIQNYTFGSYYGGHPNPVRANPLGAGLYTAPAANGTTGAVFRTATFDPDGSTPGSTSNANIALPANWPPVSVANTVEGDWRGPGIANPDGDPDNAVLTWGTNTNALEEYTASNFGGAMQGNLLAGTNNGVVRRVQLNANGTVAQYTANFISGIDGGTGINVLGLTSNGDQQIFPGTIWAGTLNGNILVFEPQDFVECIAPGEPGYDANADYDSDGYTNQDEEDNGTDPCNGGSQPNDFDKVAGAPFISDLNDPDDDADGINDAADPFQLGNPATGGSDAFTLPVNNDLFNSQQGLGGIYGLGMTGLMNNGAPNPNWLEWLDDIDQGPNPNDVLGGAPGLMTSHMTSGTALGNTNTQEKGYQYGVQVDQTTGKFTVIGNLVNLYGPLRIYGNSSAVGGELGHFIGDGTQSNYIKMVLTTDGITALQEINDVPQAPINVPIAEADRPASSIIFYFEVDPSNGEVVLEYAKDGGARTSIGTIVAQGSILTAIQQSSSDLAVGFIGTSNTPGVELEGTWDFLNVVGEVPIVVQPIPDITRLINSSDEDNDLDTFFDDDLGTGNLTYTVQNNTGPSVGAVINGNILTLSYPSTPAVSDITIRATDTDGFFVEDTFTVTVTDQPPVLFRVNTGGALIAAIDGGIDWEEDTPSNNSPYLTVAGTNQAFASSTMPVDGSVNQATTPMGIYASERFDATPGAPNMSYSFPVPTDGNYEIRLYMGNSFAGTSDPGERIFDVQLEGTVLPLLNDVDLSGTYGHQVGTVITHVVNITDGSIDISFLHAGVENPLINAIEILDAPDNDTPIYLHPIADQNSNTGQQLTGNLGANAFGGDGNLQYSAVGLPPGISIEPTNGQIGGTIDQSAAAGSPYTVTITVDDSDGLTSDAVSVDFNWVVFDAFAYRINAGGGQITSSDIGPFWEANSQNGAQQGGNFSVNTGTVIGFGGLAYADRDQTIPAYMDSNTFASLFSMERYDAPTAPEMTYSYPIGNGSYVVNIYTSNNFDEASEPGDRLFDILLEGVVVENDLDLITEFGHQVAGMLSYPVTVSDGTLNIGFTHVVENPTLNGLEVFRIDTGFPALNLNAIADQANEVGDAVSFSASAAGGDPGEAGTYYISGQPQGIGIDPASGLISGSVAVQAGSGGPNGDGVHVTRVTVMKPNSAPSTQVFTWSVDASLVWTNKNEDENYTARHECSFVQAGDKFYLMGGRENAQTLDVYDYTTNSWTALSGSAPADFNHFQAVEYQGLIWVIGAFNTNNYPNEASETHIWMFDPATSEWIEGPEIPAARQRGSAGLSLYNGKFYISGGNTEGHDGGYVNWFDEYDPATGTWTPLSNAPRARDHFHSAVVGDKLYLAGGRLSGGPGGVFAPTIAEVDVYDFTTGTWSTLPAGQNLPTPRGGATSVSFGGKLLVIGGEVQNQLVYEVNTNDALKITEQYDPVAQSWSRLPDLNTERHGTQAIVSGNGVFILGGSPNIGGGNQKNMEFLGTDAPQGGPSQASSLVVPASLLIADGDSETLAIEISGGNVGKYIRSMSISGANAADFSLDSGELSNAVLADGSTHNLQISLSGSGANRSAVLTIEYGADETAEIILTNSELIALEVTNPGNQYNYEGDNVSLQIAATSSNDLSYSATGLPPNLSINPNTGLITGTIAAGGAGSGAFQEQGGLVVIETESEGLDPTWTYITSGGETGITAGTNHFNDRNGGVMSYQITISTTGVYRFNWNSFFSGPDSTEENDAWLRFPNNSDVWFFGFKGATGSEANMISNLEGAQNNIVFPVGSSRVSAATTPEGASGNGYLKIYRSGGSSGVYDWQARTSDNDPHDVYVYFVNPGTYTMEISERSVGHVIDRVALYKVDGTNYSPAQLNGFAESNRSGGSAGAADNSPYNVTVTVTDDGDPQATEEVEFQWIIGEPGDLIAAPEGDPLEGEAPLLVNFTGSNSLDDVGVTSYLWDFDDGSPTSATADPTHTFTDPGTYVVSLTVGDGDGNSDTNTITIQVNTPTNDPPVAVAEADVVTGNAPLLVNFTGSNSTDDTSVVSYSWDFKDGNGSLDPDPAHTFATAGIYNVELTVTDEEGLTDTDVVVITIKNAPLADAGLDQTLTLPENSILLDGSGTDPDGGAVVSYLWTQQSGPSTATLSGASTDDLTASDLVEGEYVFQLTVTDDEGDTGFDEVTVTVEAGVATGAPVVEAGEDQTLTLPENSLTLDGSASDPDGGSITTYLWTQENGPSAATLAGADTEDLTASDLVEGEYLFRLTATDDEGETGFDEVLVTVLPEGGTLLPIADAGPDQTLILPENSLTLDGSASDPDGGTIVTYLWTQEDGPSTATLTGADTEDLTASDLVEGQYTFRLTVTDDEGETGFDEVLVTVLPEGETLLPIADAGPDQTLILPENSLTLDGSASDPDGGTIVTYIWTQESGPSTATLTGADTDDLTASDLVEGQYTFLLTVTDDEGETAFDEVTVTVAPEGSTLAPEVDAGPDRNVILPMNSVLLSGSATDPDGGTIVTYLWTQESGPALATLSGADTEDLTVSELEPGQYVFRLTATDDEGESAFDEVTVTVTQDEPTEPIEAILLENPSQGGIAKVQVLNRPAEVTVFGFYVHDVIGRLMNQYNAEPMEVSLDSYEIPVGTLRDGLYYVTLVMNQGDRIVLKLLVKN